MKKQIIIVLSGIIVVGGIFFLMNKLGQTNVPLATAESKVAIDSNYIYFNNNIDDFKKWSLGVYLNTKADIKSDIDIKKTQDAYLKSLDSKALKLLRDSVLSLCKNAEYKSSVKIKCNTLKSILKNKISTNYPEKKQALDSINSLLKVYNTIRGAYDYGKQEEYSKRKRDRYYYILPKYKENRVKKWGNADFEKNIKYAIDGLKIPKAYDDGFETLLSFCNSQSDCDSKFKKNDFYKNKCRTEIEQKRVQDSLLRANNQSMNTSN